MKSILIIVDNYNIRENTAEILEMFGFEIRVAENGTQGLYLVNKRIPDLILCDMRMPKMNGTEVLIRLKNNPITAEIPFVYIAATIEKNTVNRVMEIGADGCIRKPFDGDDLIDQVRQLIGS
ncbi:response regulator [Fulvivirga sp. 29W222]|uniref:Response regulator n=1 Tax=Fulvivirga marina TaxID=2494733 RepID=A0A937G165_9BACT|nr:response regulator [Fulvivirga marina]MBL6448095.1 response regulator [Fulvivirga marina]